ncbi:MAG: hypothetical protein Q8R12_02860 [bacterium]|nr:hypothetical protein [bacterium]
MIKKFIPILLATAFMVSQPLAALAQEGTTSPRQERQVEKKAKLEARRIQNIRKFFTQMGRRLEAAILRLEKMADKIASRIQKFEERSGNVSEAKAKLALAKAKIAEAKAAYADAKLKLEDALKSETPKEAFAKVREGLVKGVVEKIKEAHQALIEAVRVLKGTDQ